ncbi:MAG: SGNH/GDSL hydrolase family protein [Leptospirales bacterium]|nr:SGNH/GDSL hydrolase family protein [Leptospirales bacterium]
MRPRQIGRRLLAAYFLLLGGGIAACRDGGNPSLDLAAIAAAYRVLIIGDSLTDFSEGFNLQEKLGAGWVVAHRGVINRDFLTWTGRLDEAFDEMRSGPPDLIVVELGTNDSFLYGPELFLAHYQNFHADLRLRSQATVYYCLMPLTLIESLGPSIARNNAALRATPLPERVRLIDLEAAFASAAPAPPLYLGDDPLHPTSNGYRLIAAEMARNLQTGP